MAPTGLADGLAYASTLRHTVWRFAPAASRLLWVPRSYTPWGVGLGTNGRQTNTSPCNLHYRGRTASFFADGSLRVRARALVGSLSDAQQRAEPARAAVAAALVIVAGAIAVVAIGGQRGEQAKHAQALAQHFDAAAVLEAGEARAAARAAQLPRPARQHRLLPGQSRAGDVPVHQLPGHLPADHLEPAGRAQHDGQRRRLQSADHRRVSRPARRHAEGGRGVPRASRHDRAHAVPDRLARGTRARVEGVGGGLRTRRPAAAVHQPHRHHLRGHRVGQAADRLRRRASSPRKSRTTCPMLAAL